jgi:hypothetical protein
VDAEAATKKPDINVPLPPPPPTGLFTIKANTEASGYSADVSPVASRAACEQACMLEPTCKIFTYRKSTTPAGVCFRYARADFKSNEQFDSGIRIEQTSPSADSTASSTGLFRIRTNTEASGPYGYTRSAVASRAACEEICTRDPPCKIFTYEKINGICYRLGDVLPVFNSNDKFDSGIRIQQTK